MTTEYQGKAAKYMGVGSTFIPVAGNTGTYKLKDLSIQFEDEDAFLTPGIEYFQQLSPANTDVIGRFTYVSAEWLKDEFEDEWESKKWAIGWWNFNKNIADFIDDDDDSTMCNEKEIPVGTAFLSLVSTSQKYRIVSSGAVPTETTGITTEKNKYLYWLNYLPVSLDINKVAVKGVDEDGEVDPDAFLTPGIEYFQVLSPANTDVIGRYTYVSAEFLQDEFEDEAESKAWAIGWWEFNKKIADYIDDDDDSTMLKGEKAVTLTPGFSFLSLVSTANNYKIFFPSALDAAK